MFGMQINSIIKKKVYKTAKKLLDRIISNTPLFKY